MSKKLKKLNKNLSSFYNFLLDLIFPKYCVGCGKEGVWLCKDCKEKIIYIKNPTCPSCNRLTSNGKFCNRCRSDSYLTGVIVAAYYNEGPLKEAIHNYKYNLIFDLKHELSDILSETLNKRWNKKAYLVPVPLHKKRKAERGFNQSELLTEEICKKFNFILIKNKLVRKKYTTQQVKLSGKKRRQNMIGAFGWIGGKEIKNKTIILVDDVYTTGATLQECAKMLRLAGAREIWALVLAKV
jgi:ComF family protein